MIIYIKENNEYKKISNHFTGELTVLKNTEKAKYYGNRYGQDVEPIGNYFIQKQANHLDKFDNYKTFKVQINNPLIINVEDDVIKWKYDLAKKYKAKGKKLSDKLKLDGYDFIITVYNNGETGEIISL